MEPEKVFILQDISASGAEVLEADDNPPPDVPQYAVAGKEAGESQAVHNPTQLSPPVEENIFTRTLHHTLGFSNSQV